MTKSKTDGRSERNGTVCVARTEAVFDGAERITTV